MNISNITTKDVVTALKNFISKQEYDGFAVNCRDKGEAELLLAALHSLGHRWSETAPIITEEGNIVARYKYKSETCYRFHLNEPDIMKAQRSFYEKKGITVYTFDDLISSYLNAQSSQSAETISAKPDAEKHDSAEDDGKSAKSVSEVELHLTNTSEKNKSNNGAVLEKQSKSSENGFSPSLCKLLNVSEKEPFLIECSRILMFLPNTPYRISENGLREYLADAKNDCWMPCNDERELAYLVSHPEIIVKIK